MSEPPTEIDAFLDEVSAQIGRRRDRADLLLELRSAILDRAEDIAGGSPTSAAIHEAIQAIGDPAQIAAAYAGERYLIGPRHYRAFLVYTGLVYAIHLAMIVAASVLDSGIEIFPIHIMRVAHPHSFLNLVSVAVQALLMDIGLMVVIFAGLTRGRRAIRSPHLAFRVESSVRVRITRAVLALLVLVLLDFLRGHIFVIAVGNRVVPFFTASFLAALPWLNVFLGAVILKEVAFAVLGEGKGLVLIDAGLSAAGAALMIWFLTRPPFFAFPLAVSAQTSALFTLNRLVRSILALLLVAFAAGFAWESGRRIVRYFQLR